MMDLMESSTSEIQYMKKYQFNRPQHYGTMSSLVRSNCRKSVQVEGLSMIETSKTKFQDLQSLQTGLLVLH